MAPDPSPTALSAAAVTAGRVGRFMLRVLSHLGKNPPRGVEGLTMTHCVPDERHVVTR